MPLVPLLTNSGPTASVFAPASATGGGGGPNPSVSSLTVGPNGAVAFDSNAELLFGSSLPINSTVDNGGAQLYRPANGKMGWQLIAPNGANTFQIAVDGTYSFLETGSNQPLLLNAETIVSSLTVSSINGASPSGGTSDFSTASISSLTVSSISGVSSVSISAGDILTLNAPSLSVSAPNGVTVSAAAGMIVNAPTTLNGQTTAPQLGTSSITVSTINGSAYPPASSAYPKMSSIGLGGGGVQTQYFISTGAAAQFTTPFDVEAGHYYSLDVNFVLTAPGPAFTDHAVLDVPGANVNTVQKVIPLYPSTQTQASIKFIGTNAGQTYGLFSTDFAGSTELNLNSAIDNVVLTDFGLITTSF